MSPEGDRSFLNSINAQTSRVEELGRSTGDQRVQSWPAARAVKTKINFEKVFSIGLLVKNTAGELTTDLNDNILSKIVNHYSICSNLEMVLIFSASFG